MTKTAAIEESPDWTLVYASNRGGRFELWTQRVGGPARRLTHPPQRWQEDRAPQWSPDGRFVAFSANRPSNFNGELYLVRADGGGVRRLTFTPGSADVLGDDGMPASRADGTDLVFVSNRDRNWELYALDLRTRAATRLTGTPGVQESLPRLAPDGRYAFVVQLGGGRGRIVVADATLHGRTVRQAGTAVDWRRAAR